MRVKKSLNFGGGYSYSINLVIPNLCPHCGKNIVPHLVREPLTENIEQDEDIKCVQLIRCTNDLCLKYFAREYHVITTNGVEFDSELIEYTYNPEIEITIPNELLDLSPNFVKIYKQAITAGKMGLHQLEGIGLRKSIEFLIKDYLINLKNKNSDDIERKPLMQCINLIEFDPLKNLATAATWIGNDETHYTRKHSTKDVSDMKTFIHSASLYIGAEYSASIATEFVESN